jgi:hypothetical protein
VLSLVGDVYFQRIRYLRLSYSRCIIIRYFRLEELSCVAQVIGVKQNIVGVHGPCSVFRIATFHNIGLKNQWYFKQRLYLVLALFLWELRCWHQKLNAIFDVAIY